MPRRSTALEKRIATLEAAVRARGTDSLTCDAHGATDACPGGISHGLLRLGHECKDGRAAAAAWAAQPCRHRPVSAADRDHLDLLLDRAREQSAALEADIVRGFA